MGDKLMLDLNQRERNRFTAQFGATKELAERAMRALESENDAEFFAAVFMFGATVSGLLMDITPVLQAATTVNTDDLEGGVPPGFHPDKEEE